MSNPNNKEVYEVFGDPTAPAGAQNRGISSGYNFENTAAAKPLILWDDMLLTMDVYMLPEAPAYGIIFCPQCARNGRQNALRISQENKKFEIDLGRKPTALLRKLGVSSEQLAKDLGLYSTDDLNGLISIEHIRCSWEEDPDLRRGYGLGVCGWSVVIENNIARNV